MISFLTPLFLAGLAALVIPVLFHLRRQRLERQVPFGAMMFLEETPPPPKRRRRIEHWLLLLLRCLALALICLAFAWPVWRENQSEASEQAERQFILIDRSGSMRGPTWEAARNQALELIQDLPADTELWVGAFDDRIDWLWRPETDEAGADEPRDLAAALLRELPGPTGALSGQPREAVEDALTMATNETDGAPPRTTLHVISDFQSANRPEQLAEIRLPAATQIDLHRVKTVGAGQPFVRAIGEVRDLGETKEFAWLVVNPGETETTISLRSSNGQEHRLTLPAGGQEVVTVESDGEETVLEVAIVEGTDGVGQRAWAAAARPPEVPIAWLSNDDPQDSRAMGFYLQRALQVKGPFQVKMVETISEADMVMLNRTVSELEADALKAFAQSGGTVMVVPPDLDTLHQLENLLGPSVAEAEAAELPEDGWRMTGVDYQAPEFQPFREAPYGDFSKIPFWRARSFSGTEWENRRIIAAFENGVPALIEVPRGEGRWLIWASSWLPRESQLARSSKFVPLLYALIESSIDLPSGKGWTQAGSRASEVVVDGSPLIDPSGQPFDWKTKDRFTMPGVYRDDAGQPVLVVRPAVSELNLAGMSDSEFEQLQASLVFDAARETSRSVQVAGGTEQSDWWRYVLIGVMVLLFVETILSAWKQRAQPLAAS